VRGTQAWPALLGVEKTVVEGCSSTRTRSPSTRRCGRGRARAGGAGSAGSGHRPSVAYCKFFLLGEGVAWAPCRPNLGGDRGRKSFRWGGPNAGHATPRSSRAPGGGQGARHAVFTDEELCWGCRFRNARLLRATDADAAAELAARWPGLALGFRCRPRLMLRMAHG